MNIKELDEKLEDANALIGDEVAKATNEFNRIIEAEKKLKADLAKNLLDPDSDAAYFIEWNALPLQEASILRLIAVGTLAQFELNGTYEYSIRKQVKELQKDLRKHVEQGPAKSKCIVKNHGENFKVKAIQTMLNIFEPVLRAFDKVAALKKEIKTLKAATTTTVQTYNKVFAETLIRQTDEKRATTGRPNLQVSRHQKSISDRLGDLYYLHTDADGCITSVDVYYSAQF
jgi:hypothetical protein